MKEKPSDHVKTKSNYMEYLTEALREMTDDGFILPIIKKVTNGSHKFQVTGHIHLADALQGYWERNKNVYTHRAKSDYRALYIGTMLMLEEEKIMTEQDEEDEELKTIKTWIEQKEPKHRELRKLSLLRQEVKELLTEMDEEVISEEDFQQEVMELINTFKPKKSRIKISIHIDRLVAEELTRLKNRKYQTKHRSFEKLTKGVQAVAIE